MFEMSPAYVSHFVDDAYLGQGGCAARSVFTQYPVSGMMPVHGSYRRLGIYPPATPTVLTAAFSGNFIWKT